MCKVSENAKTSENITNIADITECKDENKNNVTDRDSQPGNVKLPSDSDLPGYKDNEKVTMYQDNKMMMTLKGNSKNI